MCFLSKKEQGIIVVMDNVRPIAIFPAIHKIFETKALYRHLQLNKLILVVFYVVHKLNLEEN